MFNVSIRECFSVLNISIVCICNTTRSKSIPLMCTHVDPYKFSTVHPPSSGSLEGVYKHPIQFSTHENNSTTDSKGGQVQERKT
jgi:hypothetical protein